MSLLFQFLILKNLFWKSQVFKITEGYIKMKILDLGCGKRKQKDAIGVDMSEDSDADVIHDLNKFPYPFEN